jgi:hypothetical protein
MGIGTFQIVRHRDGMPWHMTRNTTRQLIDAPCAIAQVVATAADRIARGMAANTAAAIFVSFLT